MPLRRRLVPILFLGDPVRLPFLDAGT